uniref:SnoaL-like domain-containing protein n=1 Tax=Caulobacter sp. (strain K31) TaxID=366602 RepID=B0T6Q2_CAUSK
MIDEKRLQDLIDKQDIYELMCRYERGVDRFDEDLVQSCFWPEATAVFPLTIDSVFKGPYSDFLKIDVESWKPYTAQQHYVCNQLCEINEDQALVETYQFSFYWKTPGDDPKLNSQNSGRYIDRCERRNGEWRIIHREFIRNFSFPIAPKGFGSVENGWPMPSQSRSDPAYRTLSPDA